MRFVTFNYDRLIERAIRGAIPGLGFGSLESFVNDARYRIYKLHGSVDWYRQTEFVRQDGHRQALEKEAQYFKPSPSVQTVGGPQWIRAISIPLATKTNSEFECPNEHLEALKADLPNVTRVISVGWRGAEDHFMKLWAEHRPSKMDGIICITGAQATAVHLGQRLTAGIQMGAQMTLRVEGFTRFLQDGTLDTWL